MRALIGEVGAEAAKCKAVKEEVKRAEEANKTAEERTRTLDIREASLQKQVKHLRERAAEMSSRQNMRMEAASRDLARAEQLRKEVDKENKETRDLLNRMESELKATTLKKAERERVHEEEKQALVDAFGQLKADLATYNESIRQAMA